MHFTVPLQSFGWDSGFNIMVALKVKLLLTAMAYALCTGRICSGCFYAGPCSTLSALVPTSQQLSENDAKRARYTKTPKAIRPIIKRNEIISYLSRYIVITP